MTIAKTELKVSMEAELNLPGQADIEQDVMETDQLKQTALLDDIENRAHILEGSLSMAMEVASERHAGAFSGMMEQVSMLMKTVAKLRK